MTFMDNLDLISKCPFFFKDAFNVEPYLVAAYILYNFALHSSNIKDGRNILNIPVSHPYFRCNTVDKIKVLYSIKQ